ncbi:MULTISPECIES: aspartate carbamoyltransferase regulatory subunit [Clostridium]|uniref:Aspartate carbamoyltransferase regulatory subunit n=1 Tax=Clostridium brassicae TaxID=2999072 RepID=A0ABT4D450_9CLOT|nr:MULTISPECIES: aspartate carbamoyltransferase regulatory subunit [Clostridium]MCY6957060.1 aspartate carbamoyltransferase regulatory subunit [Clostridium brassicae]WMJ79495.1 aspartate carbamoyltransferase regulatory subunit [Clostridium sp. MB40-C1]
MLNIDSIKNGIVIDHIKAGEGISIFNYLGLSKAEFPVALIMNTNSGKCGKKDIIKIENHIDIDFTILGLIDPNITINVIQNETIKEKINLSLPEEVENVLECQNPRCITSVEKGIPQQFYLADEENVEYRCKYCDEACGKEIFRY